MKENGNAPAYPAMDMNSHMGIDRLELRYTGFTKRELFALHAPPVPEWFQSIQKHERSDESFFAWRLYFADELLKALGK